MNPTTPQQTLQASLPGVQAYDDREALLAIQTAENALATMKAERLAAMEEARSYELDGASSLTAWARARLRLAPGETRQLVAAAAQDGLSRIGPPAELVGFGAVGPKLLGYLACGSDVIGVLTRDDAPVADVLNVGRTQRLATLKQRRAVITRQHGTCAAPGCTNTHLDIHHAVWWSRGGRTDLDQLVGLCPRCHTLVHRELLTVRALGQGTFDFSRHDGRPLASQPPPARTAYRELGSIRRINRHLQDQRDRSSARRRMIPMRA